MNIVKFLKELPEWNELIKLPAKVKELEKRIKELESPSHSLDECPKCKLKTFQLESSAPLKGNLGRLGAVKRVYKCTECDFSESKTLTLNNQ